jgi:hypothetical protein
MEPMIAPRLTTPLTAALIMAKGFGIAAITSIIVATTAIRMDMHPIARTAGAANNARMNFTGNSFCPLRGLDQEAPEGTLLDL